MRDIWVISDTHFNHKNILKFSDKHGNPVRVFDDVHHMNEVMIDNWNKHVKPGDKVYHLGDVYFGPKEEAHDILNRLHGQKRLILGNHDDVKDGILTKFFRKILLWRKFSDHGLLFTHVPVHESVLGEGRFEGKDILNVHGHIHQNHSPSKRYLNVSVEQTNYTPIHIEDLRKWQSRHQQKE